MGEGVLANEDEEGVILECGLVFLAINSIVGEEETVGGGNGDGPRKEQVVISHSGDLVNGHCAVAGHYERKEEKDLWE